MRSATFVSYSHEGADLDSIEYLVKHLKEESEKKIDFCSHGSLSGPVRQAPLSEREGKPRRIV
jgi:hypothetical protein